MPQDPNLYGQRPAKKKKTELGLSNTLDFAAQLQSLIRAKTETKKTLQTKNDEDDRNDDDEDRNGSDSQTRKKKSWSKAAAVTATTATTAKTTTTTKTTAPWNKKRPRRDSLDDAERERIRARLAAKARRYAQLQRGDDLPGAREAATALVDFDRKWAERQGGDGRGGSPDGSSEEDSDDDGDSGDDDGDAGPLVKYTDEFGRTRMVSRARRDRELRRRAAAARAAEELEAMRARPAPPPAGGLLYGDVIQTEAIEAGWAKEGGDDQESKEADDHYRAEDDVRTRGAAFYAFATGDEAARAAQMQALADERARTEQARAARSAQLEARRAEVAARRAALAERRAQKQADSFLDRLGQDLAGGDQGEEGRAGDQTAAADGTQKTH